MNRLRFAAVGVLGSFLVLGCQPQKPPPPPLVLTTRPAPPTPATADTVVALRAGAPNALIGRVIALYVEGRLAAIADVPVRGFKVGDRVSFMGNEGFLAGGSVIAIVNDNLHVKWDLPGPKGRAPIVGDLVMAEPQKP